MPNRAYASFWVRNFDVANMLSHFEHFLAAIPLAAGPVGFTELVIRAVDWTESPIAEFDLRSQGLTPAEIAKLAGVHLASDVCLEVTAVWDLWIRDMESASWKKRPERLHFSCFGPDYDQGMFVESGHFLADLGFEHIFTGHAGLLSAETGDVARPEHPEEARFLMWMSQPQNLREYQEKTRENIQKLMAWVRLAEESLPIERIRLWSEGEENFEARLDEILAVR
jgi:hypothetical protein